MPFFDRTPPFLRAWILSAWALLPCCVIRAAPPSEPPAPVPAPSVSLLDPKPYRTPASLHERLQKLLPHAYEKLSKRKSLHIVAIGDEAVDMAGHGADDRNQLLAWPAQFAMEMANEFVYPGGVRLLQPNRGKPEKSTSGTGEEITLRVISMRGGTLRSALAALIAYGTKPVPDIIIVGGTVEDSVRGGDLMGYAEALHELIESNPVRGADMILAAPIISYTEPLISSLAASRGYAGILRDEAKERGLAFVDLGDLAGLIRFNDEKMAPETVFAEMATQLRYFYTWPEDLVDGKRPNATMQQRLGAMAFRQLGEGDAVAPWKFEAASASITAGSQLKVECELTNASGTAQTFAVEALPTQAWVPAEKAAMVTLEPGAKHHFTATLSRSKTADGFQFPPFAGHEPVFRLPVLIGTTEMVRVEEVAATVKPLVMLWKLDALFNQTGTFTVDNVLLNTSGGDLRGVEWTAEWAGQKKQGKVDLAAGANSTLSLTFDLPREAGARMIASPLIFSASTANLNLQWVRAIEVSQNIGLGMDIPMIAVGNGNGTAQMRAAADAKTLVLTFDMDGVQLQDDPNGLALTAEVHLDARTFGKRLTAGACDGIVARFGVADTTGKVSAIQPWAFGTGYAMNYDEDGVAATMATQAGGHRVLTMTIPRSYLYLHEWALGNGNSQLGIHAQLKAAKTGAAFTLAQNGRDHDDAETLIVLELSPKPTSRWTVTVW